MAEWLGDDSRERDPRIRRPRLVMVRWWVSCERGGLDYPGGGGRRGRVGVGLTKDCYCGTDVVRNEGWV